MHFGVTTMTRGPLATRSGYIAIAQAAEQAGFSFISVNDHVVVPVDIASRYPYSEEGTWAGAGSGFCFDQLTTLSFLAGCTKSLRLLTAVMVVPHRHPVLTAKMLATADVLSEGRVIVGCGAGWMKEEFDLLGAPFKGRGRATDEYIQSFKALWTEDRPKFAGEFASFGNVLFEPKPVQTPHPPIWIGGESDAAMSRAVRLGDAWFPGTNNPAHRLDTPDRLGAAITKLRGMAAQAKRDPATLDLAFTVQWPVSWTPGQATDGSRRMFTGSSAQMIEDAGALSEIGVRHVALQLGADSVEETCARIQRFGAEVRGVIG